MTLRAFRLSLLVLIALAALVVFASQSPPRDRKSDTQDRFIVQFLPGTDLHGKATARQRFLDASGQPEGMRVDQLRRIAVGADVIQTSRKLDQRAAQAFMNRLRRDPRVKFVEIDRLLKPAFTPNDPNYPGQWHYYEPAGGINLPTAWDQSTGAGVVVAVIDTGITAHSDLSANIVAGYDFISDAASARDGNGYDSDPSDQGDWADAGDCGAEEPAKKSSWHGTHVAGTVAAVTNNAVGVAGVAFNAKVMPLRVLGRCGGYTSDIANAIVWAAGGAVPGVPSNPNPVEVINLSLGGKSACGFVTQQAINAAVSAGVVVVVAAGNENEDASGHEPANCQNVITVGATDRSGGRATSYSNYGPTVDISAPGGGGSNGVDSTSNTGTTIPVEERYAKFIGTSMATPHVAGVVALMQSAIVSSPAAVENILKNTARSLPIACPEGCGAGIVNASAAIAGAVTGVLIINDQSVTEGNSGSQVLTFTVSLSKPMPTAVTFDIATANGSATAGSDYVAVSLSGQSIATGATSKTFSVTVNGDTVPEPRETFFVNVSNVLGIPVADPQALGSIINDDPIPLSNGVAVGPISGSAGQTELYSLTVPAGTTSVTFTTSGGTGDADILVKFGSLPTAVNADCVSQGATTVENCTFTPGQAGIYYLSLLAYSDITGVILTGSFATSSNNAAPTASFGYLPSGLTVQFTDTSTDSDGSIASRSWNFGDASTSTATNPSKTYATAGTYNVQLTVTDNAGATASITQSVRVATPVALLTTDQYLWMVPPASNSLQQGFVRLINRENRASTVSVWGVDAAGRRSAGTLTLTLSALQARQFNSRDLELGNVPAGLSGSIGSGIGDWTLVVRSDLDLEALAYIRTPDGFLTSMHDRVVGDGVDWLVPFFNPAENPNQVSHLRVINTTAAQVSVQIRGVDDAGVYSAVISATIPALSALDLTSADLESGNTAKGLIGSLGNGSGKWRLIVSSSGRLTVQSPLYDPLGKLTNLSTVPDGTQTLPGQRVLWMVPPASNTQQQGFVRLTNREDRASMVTLWGIDDAGQRSPGTATLTLASYKSRQFNSQDLELGNAAKGLSGSLGDGNGDWRLVIETDLLLVTTGLIRTPDGFLTTAHDTVAGNGLIANVPIFNPAENPNQVSVLRLVNANAAAVSVTIQGVDDAGLAGPGGTVSLNLAGGSAAEFSAVELESGNAARGLSGSIGNGAGKWRLIVTASAPIKVLSLLRDPNGYLTDLSTGAKGTSGKLDP